MSDTNLGRAILEISTKDTDAKAGLNKFKADAESTLKQIQASFDKLGKSLSTSLNSSVGQLHSSLAKLESSGKSAAAGLKTLETGSSSAEKAAGNLHKTAITAGSGLQNLSTGASNAGGAILRLGSGAIGVAASGLEKIGSVAIAAGAALTKLGLVGGVAFAGLATLGVKSAGDLQEAVNNISTIKPDIDTSAVFKSLNDISTRVPQSAKQLGDSLYNIFSSIQINQKDALSLVEKFAKGAIGAQTDADTWGTAMLGVMNAYGKGLGDVDKIQDTFFNTINAGVVNGKQLASSLGPVTASAKTAGLSIEELGAAIVGVTKEGGDASQNINNLNNYLEKVTTKEAQAAMNNLGVKTVDATGKFRPFADVLTDLKGRLSTMTQAQRANALQAIFPDAQARQGAIVLMSQLDAVKSSLKENESATGSATAAYQKMASGMKAQAALLKNSVVADLTAMGSGMLPAITPGITALAQAFQSQQGNFERLGKFLGAEITNGITLARDSLLTFKAALSGNWADASNIRPLHALIGNLGLIIHNDIIPAWDDFTSSLGRSGLSVGKLVETFSPLSVALSTVRGFMVGGLNGAFDAFQLRVKSAGDALEHLADALGLGPQFDAIKRVIGPVVDSVMGFVGAIVQVINKSDAIGIAGDIISKAFSGISEVFSFVTRLINDNIGPISEGVKAFGNTVKGALDIAIGAFKALEGPITAVVGFLAPLAPAIGVAGGAFVTYKGVMTLVDAATNTLSSSTGSMLLNIGKVALVLAPAIGAFELAAKVVPGFATTLDQLGFMATHVGDTVRTMTKSVEGINNPFVAQGSAIHDAQGKLIGYANAFETTQQAQERLNNQTKAGLNIFTDASKSYGYTELNLAVLNKTMTFGYELSYKYRDALTGQLNVMTKNGSVLQYLLTSHQALAPVVSDQAVKMNSLADAIANVNNQGDKLNQQLNAIKSNMSGVDAGVSQLALKVGDATIAYKDQNLTLGDAYNKWKDLTAVQLAGGTASYAAGVEAGKLKDQMIGLVGQGVNPFLDAQFKNIGALGQTTTKIGETAVAASGLSGQMVDTAGSISNANRRLGEFGETKLPPKKVETNFPVVETNISNATKRLGEWNTTPLNPKNAVVSGIDAVVNALRAAVDAIHTWNSTPLVSKSATATYNTQYNGSNGATPGVSTPAPSARPAPVNPGNRSPQSVGGASALGLTSDLGSILKGGGIAAPLAAATQQATQAAFSLGGLQSQINDIISLFKSLDAKALKAASDQAEQVSKIVSAASGMADLFGKLKDYASVSKATMTQFSADSVEMTNQYIAGAKQFDAKALKGAEQYIDTSGKVASAASSMADTLVKLRDWEGPINASIEGFAYNAKVLTANYYNASLEFNKDMLDATDRYSDTTGKVGDSASKNADALVKILDWKGVATVSIEGFVFNQKVLTANYYNASLEFNDKMLEGAGKFAEASAKVADSTGKGADSLAKLKDWEGIATVSIEGFAFNMKVATANFYNASREFDEKMLKGAGDFAETSGKVAQAIGQGVTGLSGLNDYKGIPTAIFETFTADLDMAVLAFSQFAVNYQSDSLKAAGVYAETAGKIVGVLKPGVEGFAGLADYKAIAADKLGAFEADLYKLMQDTTTAAATFKPAALEAGKAWGDAVGGISTGLVNSIKLFEGLQTYKSVPSATITLFINDIELTVHLAGQMAERAKGPLLDRLKEFTDATGGLFTELSNAMSLFKGLQEFKSTPSTTIQAFIDEIEITVNKTDALAKKTDTDLLARAKNFSKAVGGIFSELNTAITTFKGLQDLKDDPGKTVDVLIGGVNTAINKMGGAQTAANNLYNEAVAFHKKMQDAANEMAAGMQAGANMGSPGATTSGLSGFSPLRGGSQALSLSLSTSGARALSSGSGLSAATGIGSGSSATATASAAKAAAATGVDVANSYLDAIQKIFSAIKQGIDTFNALADYPGLDMNALARFQDDLSKATGSLLGQAKQFSTKDLEIGGVWGDAVGKIINGVKNGVDLFTQLKDYASPPKQAVQAFEAGIYTVVSDFNDMAGKFKIEAITSAGVWADGVGKLVGGIKPGIDLLVSLKNYSSPAQKGVIAFEKDMYSLVFDMAEGASDFKPEAIAAAAAWGEGIGKLFSGVGNAFQVFDGLTKFKGVSQGQAQLLFNQVDMVTGMVERLAVAADMEALDKAGDYAAGIDKIYSSFNNVFEFYNNLDHLRSSPVDLITGFLNAFKAVGSFNWQPSASPAISALSSGSSVPQLSAGISMPVPGAGAGQPIIIEGNLVVTLPNAQLPLNQVQANQTAQMISTAIKDQAKKI
jgi:TP901 family phage tail tape measure protein